MSLNYKGSERRGYSAKYVWKINTFISYVINIMMAVALVCNRYSQMCDVFGTRNAGLAEFLLKYVSFFSHKTSNFNFTKF